MEWTINVTSSSDGAAREFRFGQAAVRVGRDPKVEICLNNAELSRLHFTLKRQGSRLHINDSSRNGTFVRVDGRWTRVRGSTEIALPAELRAASWTFGVTADEADAPAVPARPELAPEATWEQSVMLPAGYLKTVREAIPGVRPVRIFAAREPRRSHGVSPQAAPDADGRAGPGRSRPPLLQEHRRRLSRHLCRPGRRARGGGRP